MVACSQERTSEGETRAGLSARGAGNWTCHGGGAEVDAGWGLGVVVVVVARSGIVEWWWVGFGPWVRRAGRE